MLPREVKSALDYPVPAHGLNFGYALGGMALSVFGLLFLTGVTLAYFGYTPTASGAYQSLLTIVDSPVLSKLRAIHHVSAEVFLIIIVTHATRIVLTKSYLGARRMTWNVGILLLILASGFFFTGTLLKWDQEGYEAFAHLVWVNGYLPYGDEINALFFEKETPLKMFVLHTAVFPLVIAALMGAHMLLIKILKISEPAPAAPASPETKSFFGHLRVVSFYSAIITAVIVAAAWLHEPSLTSQPYDNVEWTKPPWPFLFLYSLENWFGVWPLMIAPPVLLAWLLLTPSLSGKTNRWDAGQVLYLMVVALVLTLILIGAWSPVMRHIM